MHVLNIVCGTKYEDKQLVCDSRQDVLSYGIQMKFGLKLMRKHLKFWKKYSKYVEVAIISELSK